MGRAGFEPATLKLKFAETVLRPMVLVGKCLHDREIDPVGFRNSSGRLGLRSAVRVVRMREVSLAVVVRVFGSARPVRAGDVGGAVASVEGARDSGVAARVGGAASSVFAAEADAGGSCVPGCVEPFAATRGLGELRGDSGDVAALASPACCPSLDHRSRDRAGLGSIPPL
jgi:hypothetical protein